MKSLKTIQGLSKAGKILSTIAFILISFILKCGTELAESKKEEENI